MTRTLTPLQIKLIERHRQQSSGRMTASMAHERQEPAKSAKLDITDPAYIASVYAFWNAPKAASPRE